MADTVKVVRDPEFFPFYEGFILRYHHTSTRFEGVEEIELVIKDVRAFREDATATASMTRSLGGHASTATYRLRRTTRQVHAEGGVLGMARQEFPMPLVAGKRWVEGAETHEVAALDAVIEVPAGRFMRCLRVNTSFEGGSSIRYYAPGIGCVYEERSSKDAGSRVRLVSFDLPGRKL